MEEFFNDFEAYIRRFVDPVYFHPKELLVRHNAVRNGVQNGPPPRDLWKNIVPTLLMVDELRHRCGFPIRITSAYRSPAYNRAINGAQHSQHKLFKALDIQPVSGKRSELREMYRVLIAMRDENYRSAFRGGIGKYATFIHVDTRGVNATW